MELLLNLWNVTCIAFGILLLLAEMIEIYYFVSVCASSISVCIHSDITKGYC